MSSNVRWNGNVYKRIGNWLVLKMEKKREVENY